MSEVSTFINEHLIDMLEAFLVAHEPELQADFLAEMKIIAEKATAWIDSKIPHHPAPNPIKD
jgi:hypothetical protein